MAKAGLKFKTNRKALAGAINALSKLVGRTEHVFLRGKDGILTLTSISELYMNMIVPAEDVSDGEITLDWQILDQILKVRNEEIKAVQEGNTLNVEAGTKLKVFIKQIEKPEAIELIKKERITRIDSKDTLFLRDLMKKVNFRGAYDDVELEGIPALLYNSKDTFMLCFADAGHCVIYETTPLKTMVKGKERIIEFQVATYLEYVLNMCSLAIGEINLHTDGNLIACKAENFEATIPCLQDEVISHIYRAVDSPVLEDDKFDCMITFDAKELKQIFDSSTVIATSKDFASFKVDKTGVSITVSSDAGVTTDSIEYVAKKSKFSKPFSLNLSLSYTKLLINACHMAGCDYIRLWADTENLSFIRITGKAEAFERTFTVSGMAPTWED